MDAPLPIPQSSQGTVAAAAIASGPGPSATDWQIALPSARVTASEKLTAFARELSPENSLGAGLEKALHAVKGFSSAEAAEKVRTLIIQFLVADKIVETFAQNIARRPQEVDSLSLKSAFQQKQLKDALKPLIKEVLGAATKDELVNHKASEIQSALLKLAETPVVATVTVLPPISERMNPRFRAGLESFKASPFFVHGLSIERMHPMLTQQTPAKASMFGLGCVTSVGVGGGIALEVLGMYFRQLVFNRMFEIPNAVVVIARDIASASAHVETGNLEHKRQLDRILSWHLKIAERVKEFDPSLIITTDQELKTNGAWAEAEAARMRVDGLPRVNRYSIQQDITVEAARIAHGATVKGGWTTWSPEAPIEYDRLLVREGHPEAGSCEGGFDHYSMQAFPGAMSYFYGPAAYSFKSNEETACPYVAPPNMDGTREGRIPLHILAADDMATVIPPPEEIIGEARHFRRYSYALDRLVSIFALAHAFDARLVPQGIAREFEPVSQMIAELQRRRDQCEVLSGSERSNALEKLKDDRLECARAQRRVLMAQIPLLIGRFGFID
jgi:hypothetical protein